MNRNLTYCFICKILFRFPAQNQSSFFLAGNGDRHRTYYGSTVFIRKLPVDIAVFLRIIERYRDFMLTPYIYICSESCRGIIALIIRRENNIFTLIQARLSKNLIVFFQLNVPETAAPLLGLIIEPPTSE